MISLQDFIPDEPPSGEDKGSYLARNIASGEDFLVNYYRNNAAPEGESVASRLSLFPPSERARILDFGRDRSIVFFITMKELPGNQSFPQWIRSALTPRDPPVAGIPEPPPPFAPAPDPAEPPPGEFTQYFASRQGGGHPPEEREVPAPYVPARFANRGANEERDRFFAPQEAADRPASDAMDYYRPASAGPPAPPSPRYPPAQSELPAVRADRPGSYNDPPRPEYGRPVSGGAESALYRWKPWLLTLVIVMGTVLAVVVTCRLFGVI